ncbi:MAG TPA: type VII secretion protein EccCa, partial [Mycobacteriales bacterium]|nr:type VII secretion protein EccCa [Mycobacteriales bacterium]
MSTIVFRRPPRRLPPELPRGEILLESPPELPEVVAGNFTQALTYLPMLAGAGSMVFLVAGPGARPITYVASGMFGLSMIGMMFGQIGRGTGERKQRLNAERRDYLRYLGQMRRRVRRAAAQQREALSWRNPEPGSLWSVVMSSRLWERRGTDADFGHVRIATGAQRLAVRLIPPETKPVEDLEPMTSGALRRFVRTHSTVPDLPVAISLRAFARVLFTGEPVAVRDLARAMLAQLAALHSPDDLRIVVCAGPDRLAEWAWVKWLPHALHPTEYDAAGQVRLVSGNLVALENLLGADLKDRPRFTPKGPTDEPHHVIVVDGGRVSLDSQLAAGGIQGVTVLDLSDSVNQVIDAGTLRLHVGPDQVGMISKDRASKDVITQLGRPDRMGGPEAEGLARQLAPYRSSTAGGEAPDSLSVDLTLTSLLGVNDPFGLDPAVAWRPRAARNRLRVPIGIGQDGTQVELDIKESAQDGMGPHGLVIGATGSGKSELLRTLVLGLAMTHSSETLNFVLVDFKGGATFLGLDSLPHVSAVITNLEDELPLVDRMQDAIHGEMVRRQELLRAAGNYASLRDYERAREQGSALKPLPSLFVVVDEFSELLSAKPDFIEQFVMIGRLGRSLGVHLLLASQRLEEGKLRGLDTHLSYRIGLRTFSAAESRVVLGVPDAYELPPQPGNGYLKFDTTNLVRFKAAYVSGPFEARERPRQQSVVQQQVVHYGVDYIEPRIVALPTQAAPEPQGEERSLLDIVVGRLAGHGLPAHQVWLAPLGDPPALDHLLPPLEVTERFGLTTPGWDGRGHLSAPVGIVDKPFEQRRDPLWVDLSGAAGHVGVVGGPQSGKSTMLRTLITSFALTHTPEEVQFYCLDFGGGGLGSLSGLPHVGGVAGRLDADQVRRTVAEVTGLLEAREKEFAERGIDSIATYRRLRRDGTLAGDSYGDVFLLVDGWLTVRQDHEALEATITNLAGRGLGFGVHVVIATNKWSEFRPGIRDLLGTRLELRLGDPYESEINRKLAGNVPEGSPGRGLTRDGLHFLSALPRIDGGTGTEDLAEGTRQAVDAVAGAWPGAPAPRVRLLPFVLPFADLPAPGADTRPGVPIGIDEEELAAVYLDFAAEPHFLVIGDTECGKSNLLRVIAQGITTRYTPQQARIMMIDYRRSLLDAADTEHRIGYAAASTAAQDLVKSVAAAMNKRLPPADVTADQLRSRSWWSGSDLYLIVDDYDLVATPSSNPLAPLAELLPQARDIGLHVILARSAGGAG